VARVPEAELERLKAEVSVQRLAEARGVELRRHGADLIGLCPFHEDHEPSLVISPAKNLWHCLGACQAGGSVVDWVMRAEGVSFRHAVELLREDLPPFAAASPSSRPVKVSTVRRLPAPVERDADDQELLVQVLRYYHSTLQESPEALRYLGARGLGSSELIERFQLGFANRTLGLRLPEKTRRAGEEIRTRLQRLGILRESGHEHFNGSLVIPVVDTEGRVTEVYGRKISADLRAGTPLHLYLPGPREGGRGVWNEAALAACPDVVLCEALIDALSLWEAGHRNVTAAYGVEGFTEDHLEALRRHGVERVLIAYDRDPAGDRAAVQLASRLVGAGIDAYRVLFPQGQDANSFLVENPATAEERFAVLLRKAVWLGSGQRPGHVVPAVANGSTPAAPLPAEAPSEAAKEEPPPPPPFAAPPLPAEPPVATPQPPAPRDEVAARVSEQGGGEVVIQRGAEGGRRWRVRGLQRNTSYDLLRVNLLVAGEGGFHVDTLDLYAARQRLAFVKEAAQELGIAEEVIKEDLAQVLLRVEELADAQVRQATETREAIPALDEAEEREALELLRDPRLLERVLEDFERCGVVGEETNKLAAYLAATSRLLEQPLAVVVQSSSAAGKSSLLEAVLDLLPEEARVKYSAVTGQSLFYLRDGDLAHKVLAVVEERGAERAAYALKLLQSEGELSIASTGKDAATGRLVTHEYRVRGPVAILLTTTAVDVDEELLNRCLVLSVDEERAQTRAIHERQRQAETLPGLLRSRDRERVMRLHRNAQRLLRPLVVVNPYAERLTFSDARTRMRRDHMKYLTLIRAVTLLHQHQRELRTVVHQGEALAYIEVTADDIRVANRLAHEVLGRSLDELPPQTRRLLQLLDEMVAAAGEREAMARGDIRLTRREIREALGWGDTQLKCHLARLVEMEHLLVHRVGRGFAYELLWDGQGRDGSPFLAGLIDPEAEGGLDSRGYDSDRSGANGERAGSGRASVGPRSGGGRSPLSAGNPNGHHGDPAVDAGRARASTVPVAAVAG
jgi:DNA primase